MLCSGNLHPLGIGTGISAAAMPQGPSQYGRSCCPQRSTSVGGLPQAKSNLGEPVVTSSEHGWLHAAGPCPVSGSLALLEGDSIAVVGVERPPHTMASW